MTHKPDAPVVVDDHGERVHPYTQSSFISGMMHSIHGVLHVFEHERNARIHLLFAVAAFVLGVGLQVSAAELAAVFFAVVLVFVAEIFNTAIERTLDLIDIEENPRIHLIKDMAAGGVLVAAVASVMLGVVRVGPRVLRLIGRNYLY